MGPSIGSGAGGDTELRTATNQGRASIRTFLDAFTRPTANQGSFRVKIAFVRENTIEHFWLGHLDLSGTNPTGVIVSTAQQRDPKFDQRVEFNPSHLSDWMYIEDGKLVGGFTTRILHRRMTAGEKPKLDAELAYHHVE